MFSSQVKITLVSPIAQLLALWNRRSQIRSSAWPIFIPRIDDSHCDRIHSCLTAVHCFDIGYVGKQPVAWKEYCVEYWLKEPQESMDRCTGHHDITEILLKIASNTIQSINSMKSPIPSSWYFSYGNVVNV